MFSCSAPFNVTISDIGPTSFEVDITPREGYHVVKRNEATAVGEGSYSRSCTGRAGVWPLTVACLPVQRDFEPVFARHSRTGKVTYLPPCKNIKIWELVIKLFTFLDLAD